MSKDVTLPRPRHKVVSSAADDPSVSLSRRSPLLDRFYSVTNVNKLESVFIQKIFDPTFTVLINIKQLNKTV